MTDGGQVNRSRHWTAHWTAVPVLRYGAHPYLGVFRLIRGGAETRVTGLTALGVPKVWRGWVGDT